MGVDDLQAAHMTVKSIGTLQGHRHNHHSGGVGKNGMQSAQKFLPYYIKNLKICIKISILLLNISMIVHFLAMQLHNTMF